MTDYREAGDPISLKLFPVTIQEVCKINIDGEKLLDLRFTDDVALTTEDAKDMEHQLNTERREPKDWSQDT